MSDLYFHFTLGPVQGFVAQARRTRDFWAGSFLLSYLSAVAMIAVEKQHGEIIFPSADKNYLGWLENPHFGSSKGPQQGCIPNRFKGGLAKVPDSFQPELISESVQQAWQAIAELVWQQDLTHCGSDTRKIWERQIKHCWEISWALSTQKTESNLLDRRKNWRSHLPPQEPGVKCMMMEGWQELSGINTPNEKGLSLFWEAIRNQDTKAIQTDLRQHEYLCAIAFIKRRFAHCFDQLKAPMPNHWTLHGWKVNASVPSVAYIAAAPWLAHVLRHAPEAELKAFHDSAKQLTQGYGEYPTRLDCIDQVLAEHKDDRLFWKTKSLDGNVFFEPDLDNKNLYDNQNLAQTVKRNLQALKKSLPEPTSGPSPFYAILMMDGDSLGNHMSDENKQQAISKSLETFTQGVNAIVENHSGFLIYAGGDDVLALLPLETALTCAKVLRQHYLDCFKARPDINTTLSGAIEYAHIHIPLKKILSDAHQLLDDIAKDQSGRDAIAVRVWKPGGQHLQWAMPWEKAINNHQVVIDSLAKQFQQDQSQSGFSNRFFFNIEQRFSLLNINSDDQQSPFNKDILLNLIAAEYLNSGVNDHTDKTHKIDINTAKQRLKPLLEQCFEVKRQIDNPQQPFLDTHHLNTDALHLVRFLAQKGVDHG